MRTDIQDPAVTHEPYAYTVLLKGGAHALEVTSPATDLRDFFASAVVVDQYYFFPEAAIHSDDISAVEAGWDDSREDGNDYPFGVEIIEPPKAPKKKRGW